MAKKAIANNNNRKRYGQITIYTAMLGDISTNDYSSSDQVKIVLERIRNVITALSLMVAIVSVVMAYMTWRGYHSRAKKDRAIVLLQDLAKTLTPVSRAAQQLQSHLGLKQLEGLRDCHGFDVQRADQELLNAAINDSSSCCKAKLVPCNFWLWSADFNVSRKQSFELRWQIVSFLNALEVVCQAYASDVADKEIIVQELNGLYSENSGYFCHNYRHFMDHFREKSPPGVAPTFQSVKHYPGIEKVVIDLKKRRETTAY